MKKNIAGLGKRITGGGIDIIIVVIVSEIFIRLFGIETGEGWATLQITGLPFLIMTLTIMGYYIVLEATTGKTLGKIVNKTKVISIEGDEISWKESLIRNVIRIVDGFFFYLFAIIVIASSKENQRLGDIVARTIVVNE